MEDTLRAYDNNSRAAFKSCLNPCFNGRYSQSRNKKKFGSKIQVLILVLMEDTLREQDIRILYISGIGIYKPKQIGFC